MLRVQCPRVPKYLDIKFHLSSFSRSNPWVDTKRDTDFCFFIKCPLFFPHLKQLQRKKKNTIDKIKQRLGFQQKATAETL